MIIGIDPGKSGGIALLIGRSPTVFPMPLAGKELDLGKLASLLVHSPDPSIAYVEKVHAMPKQGVSSTFSFGKGYGCILGILAAYNIPTQLVTPQEWKKVTLKGTAKDKAAAIQFCRMMYPTVDLLATPKSRVPHDGMADALCIAHYGYLQNASAS